jgi:hypothetical protein
MWVAYMTIVRKEISRFLSIWPQTSAVGDYDDTVLRYFGAFIGSQYSR